MPWVKIDEDFYDHPKFVDLSAGAIGLWVIGLAYSNRYLLDGALPKRGLARAYPGNDRERHAKALVKAGLWDPTDDGWQIHDYLKYQPSKAQVEAQRAERSAAGKRGAAKRWARQEPSPEPPDNDGNSHSNSHGTSDSNSNGKPNAPSRPVPLSTSRLHSSSTGPVDNSETTTTEDRHPEALAACQQLAIRALDLRRSEKPDDAPPPGRRTEAWLRAATTDQLAAIGDQAHALAVTGLDAAAIVAELASPGPPRPSLAVVRPSPEPYQPPDIDPDPELNTSRLRAARGLLRGEP